MEGSVIKACGDSRFRTPAATCIKLFSNGTCKWNGTDFHWLLAFAVQIMRAPDESGSSSCAIATTEFRDWIARVRLRIVVWSFQLQMEIQMNKRVKLIRIAYCRYSILSLYIQGIPINFVHYWDLESCKRNGWMEKRLGLIKIFLNQFPEPQNLQQFLKNSEKTKNAYLYTMPNYSHIVITFRIMESQCILNANSASQFI